MFILLFVDDGLLVAQKKSLIASNYFLFCNYHITFFLLEKLRLIIKYRKIEMFHFSRSHGVFEPPSLDLSPLGSPILCPRNMWHYLRFIFNRKLSFCQHINFYANKAISIVKYMRMLRNSVHGLVSNQKWLLYRSYVFSIALYRFQLWCYNKTPLSYFLKELDKM